VDGTCADLDGELEEFVELPLARCRHTTCQ